MSPRYYLSIMLGALLAGELIIIALLLEVLRFTNFTDYPPTQESLEIAKTLTLSGWRPSALHQNRYPAQVGIQNREPPGPHPCRRRTGPAGATPSGPLGIGTTCGSGWGTCS